MSQYDDLVERFSAHHARGFEDGLRAAAEVADQWASSHSCDYHDDNPCCHVRTGAAIAEEIRNLKES